MSLKVHQVEVLRDVCARGSVPLSNVDGRALRPLLRLGMVESAGGKVRPTSIGREAALETHSSSAARGARESAPDGPLSESQETVLRHLIRQTGPVPADHLDGRVLRALSRRSLIEESRGWVRPSATAEEYFQRHARRDRERSERRAASSPRGARSEAILRTVADLELALPRGAELMVAGMPVYGDDVVTGLRKLAREME